MVCSGKECSCRMLLQQNYHNRYNSRCSTLCAILACSCVLTHTDTHTHTPLHTCTYAHTHLHSQAVERKRLHELDRWREQQAATGDEEDNANFAPVQVWDIWRYKCQG
jgi:hypothetical protein